MTAIAPSKRRRPEIFGVQSASARRRATLAAVSLATVLAIWMGLTEFGIVNTVLVPSPGDVFRAALAAIRDGSLLRNALASLLRVLEGFTLALVIAVPLGVLMGVSGNARGLVEPLIELLRPIPPIAFIPLAILWFGIGEFSKLYLIFLAIFAPLAIAARSGVRSVSTEQIHAAYSMGATRSQVIWHVILKSALPEIFTGMRIGIGVGWTTLVAGEMVASNRGLGFMVLNAAEFLASDVVIMGIIVIGLFAFSFDVLMRYLEKVLVPWKGKV